ncbi:hypothetical protein AMR41_14495 [Hapalosiphon sp. MRB220]|nr:hypothetical protein AMR41_14495 [Hapalosiphon sp. MRB220]
MKMKIWKNADIFILTIFIFTKLCIFLQLDNFMLLSYLNYGNSVVSQFTTAKLVYKIVKTSNISFKGVFLVPANQKI